MTKPTFAIACAAFSSTSRQPVAGPARIIVRRSMDTPADYAEIHFAQKPSITVGKELTVKLGLDGSDALVFTGDVVAVTPAIVGVTVRALGKLNDLLNLRIAMTFEKKTAGDIVKALISKAGLSAGTVTAGSKLPSYAIDTRISAYAHARELADRLGFELYTSAQGKVMFHAPQVTAIPPDRNFAYGERLLDAAVTERPPAWGKVTVGAESPVSKDGEKTAHWLTTNDKDYRGTAGTGKPETLVIDPAARTTDMAKTFSAGYKTVGERRAKQISLLLPGAPEIDLGDAVGVKGVPDNITDEKGYVCVVEHDFGADSGFITRLRVSAKV